MSATMMMYSVNTLQKGRKSLICLLF
jgi:hypothetical protein